ncbi:hypothetical protein UT300009_08910 [Paraclostridium bifermentans]
MKILNNNDKSVKSKPPITGDGIQNFEKNLILSFKKVPIMKKTIAIDKVDIKFRFTFKSKHLLEKII